MVFPLLSGECVIKGPLHKDRAAYFDYFSALGNFETLSGSLKKVKSAVSATELSQKGVVLQWTAAIIIPKQSFIGRLGNELKILEFFCQVARFQLEFAEVIHS